MRLFRVAAVVLLCLLLAASPALAAPAPLKVYYAGPEGAVKTALKLAEVQFVSDPGLADVLVLNDTLPNPRQALERMQAGAGVLLILGPGVTAGDLGTLLQAKVTLAPLSEPVTLRELPAYLGDQMLQPGADPTSTDPLLRDILWNTAPQLRERQKLTAADGSELSKISLTVADRGSLQPLISGHETGEVLLARKILYEDRLDGDHPVVAGRLYLVTARLDGDNAAFRDWGYFNYLVYHLATQAAGRAPLSFGKYPASPVPHPAQQMVLYIGLAVMLGIALTAFLLVRRYSLAHPELLDTLVRNRQAFAEREAGTDWEQIGVHRPLGGFMFALISGIFLFIPLTVYNDMILPVYILPSAQALGIYSRVAAFFPIVWSLFDMGTSVAHMKFFSEYRVRNPRRAIQYAQFYVWWQALTGAVQVALVVGVVGTYLPQSAWALYTWAVITHTMIQIPGFYRLFTDAFSGIQRSDYGTILDMGINLVFPMFTQAIIVSLMVWWGKSQPVYGMAMGGVFGMGLAAYATELVSFSFGWYLYKRLGYNPRLLMMAHFSKEVAWDSLKYGFFLFVSGMVGGLGSSINVLVIQSRLLNNNEVLGNIGLAGSFSFAYTVFQSLTGAMMPSISEAVSNGRKILAQYYATSGYKYGGMVNGFLCAILLAVADRFILGSSGPSFARAASYVVPLVISGAMGYASWNAEMVMYGAGKTRMMALLAAVDMLLGLGLAYLLIDRFQAYGLLAVPFITTPVRFGLGYYLNHRYSFPQRFYFWQSLGAPALAGIVHYLIIRGLTGLIWQGDEITSILILVIALIPSYPLYAFFYGLAGGWDDNTLNVYDRGTRLTSFMRPIARFLYQATALGARLSPLHNRFPFTNHEEAMAEARSLTEERVSLVAQAQGN